MKKSFEEGDISPQRIETARNLSDCMTKALPREVIDRLVGGLTGYEDIPSAPGPAPRYTYVNHRCSDTCMHLRMHTPYSTNYSTKWCLNCQWRDSTTKTTGVLEFTVVNELSMAGASNNG